jgi:hypothetical protein
LNTLAVGSAENWFLTIGFWAERLLAPNTTKLNNSDL